MGRVHEWSNDEKAHAHAHRPRRSDLRYREGRDLSVLEGADTMTNMGQPAREPKAGRPGFPADYGIETSDSGLISWQWALERLQSTRNYWVCTASPDGQPHAAPVWGVVLDGMLYFSTDTRSVKGRNLVTTGQVVVHLESGDEVVILEGNVERFNHTDDIAGLGSAYQEKYGIDVSTLPGEDSAWFAVKTSVAYGWREADFQASATRWEF
jgi:hypothetical protein